MEVLPEAFAGRALTRREFLKLGGTGLVGGGRRGVWRCRRERPCRDYGLGAGRAGGSQEALEISTSRDTVRGILYPVESATGAVVMVGGAGGDTTGPTSIYEELATRLQAGAS